MLRMLIAIDGSDPSRRAIDVVARLVPKTFGLQAVLLNVRAGPAYFGELPPFDHTSIDRAQQQVQDVLLKDGVAHALRSGLVHVSSEGLVGEVAGEIVRYAERGTFDQIVLGTHGRGPVGTLFLGSVAQRVIHLARLPVLLVR